jgi:hypothetical protein
MALASAVFDRKRLHSGSSGLFVTASIRRPDLRTRLAGCFAPDDHMREINKQSAELTERYWRNEIMKLLDAEGER